MEDIQEVSRVLVIDDDVDSLDLFHFHLANEQREVCTFSNPSVAIDKLRTEKWDVVITDIMMPEIDGFTIIKTARQSILEIPCIAITGYGTVQSVKKALEIDCFGYINKPFDWTYLRHLVDKAIVCINRYRRQHGLH